MPPAPRTCRAPSEDPAQWVDRYGDALLRFALTRVSHRDVAEDLVQETFVAALRNRTKFDGRCDFGTWLVAILKRKVIDHHRRSGRNLEVADSQLGPTDEPFTASGKWTSAPQRWQAKPGELLENAEFWQVYDRCAGQLPSHLHQAFVLREVQHLATDRASEQLGITAKNLAVRLHRARLLLRACLEKKWFRPAEGGAS